MPQWNAITQLLPLGLVVLGGLFVLFRMAAQAAAKTGAEEATKILFRKLEWPELLARELQKSRGLARQDFRFKSYAALWQELRPLAIYDPTILDKQAAGELSKKLTDWYFSEYGGLLLTPQAQPFYFALQDLLSVTSGIAAEWRADRSESSAGDAAMVLGRIFKAQNANDASDVLEYFSASVFKDWEQKGIDLGKTWGDAIKALAKVWTELNRTGAGIRDTSAGREQASVVPCERSGE